MILYFAYGSCMEKASFDETMEKANAVETAAMLQKMREGRFECLVTAPGGVIAEDVKER